MWATIGVESDYPGLWTDLPLLQEYRGHRLLLLPATEAHVPTVNLRRGSLGIEEAFRLLRRFLSAASWSGPIGFRETARGGGSEPGRYSRGSMPFHRPNFVRLRPLWAAEPSDRRALLALAFHREAITEENPVYRYLSFYKVVETAGIGEAKSKLRDLAIRYLPAARARASQITAFNPLELVDDSQMQRHLYQQCRCAIAHAHSDPLIDPDDARDTRSISEFLPLVQALAEVVISEEYKVPRYPPNGIWPPCFRADPITFEPMTTVPEKLTSTDQS